MTPANSGLTAILCGVLIGFSGCGQSETANPLMSDNDTLLNELLGSAEPEVDRLDDSEAGSDADSSVSTVSSGLEIPSTENDTSESIVDDILGSRTNNSDSVTAALIGNSNLPSFTQPGVANTGAQNSGLPQGAATQTEQAVQLRAGDQFPFLKTVRQTVVQKKTFPGQLKTDQVTAQTLMQLTLNLSVLDSSATGHVMQVRYDRVQYSQDVNGQKQTFDSAARSPNGQLSNQVPAGIEAYAGMVGAGFRFMLTTQNQINGTDGLGAFLDQCVSATPFDQRVSIRAALEQRFQSGAITELVDESIGLLPYGSSIAKTGDVWVTDRQLKQQSPIQMQTTCRLISTSSTAAEIGLTGRIESSAGSAFRISDGRTMGTCLVDLATGMPVHSHRSSYLKMSSQPAAHQSVEIIKQIESTFTSQNESAKLLVQRHRATASQLGMSAMANQQSGPAMTIKPYSRPAQSAMLPNTVQRNYGIGQNPNLNPPLQVQPVSSANPYNGSPESSGLQIPSGGFGSVPADDLRSSVEAVYPD